MILLFDIGNTNTHLGLANSKRVVKQANVPTAAWFNGTALERVVKFAARARLEGSALCSVVPRATVPRGRALARADSRTPEPDGVHDVRACAGAATTGATSGRRSRAAWR